MYTVQLYRLAIGGFSINGRTSLERIAAEIFNYNLLRNIPVGFCYAASLNFVRKNI
jgi:hypothetical protein